MGKGTKERTKKLTTAMTNYGNALMYYNAEIEQLKHDKAELTMYRKTNGNDLQGIANLQKALSLRVEHVLGADIKRLNDASTALNSTYNDLVTYFTSKKPKEQANKKYDDMKKLIEQVKATGVVKGL